MILRDTLLLATAVAFFGCAASSSVRVDYDAVANRSEYRSDRIRIGLRDMNAGLVSGQRVFVQAVADCQGEGCLPTEVHLAFFNESDNVLNLDDRRLEIVYDGTARQWLGQTRMNVPFSGGVPRGEFVRVPMSADEFTQMANAKDVRISFGETGTARYDLSHAGRLPFRALAERLAPAGSPGI